MKVKNIAFSGFAAAVMLSAGVANAATTTQIASKTYVDNTVGAVDDKVTTLNTTLTEQYTKTNDMGTVINQNITNAINNEDGAIKTALDSKADASDVQTLTSQVGTNTTNITNLTTQQTTNTGDISQLKTDVSGKANKLTGENIKAGNIATISADGNYTAGTVAASELVTNATVTEKITAALEGNDSVKEIITNIVGNGDVVKDAIDKSVTEGTLKTELGKKADKITVTAEQAGNLTMVDANGQYQVVDGVKAADVATTSDVTTIINSAITADDGAIKTELDKKADAATTLAGYGITDAYTKTETDAKIIDLAIPRPTGNCASESGRCVLSVDTEGSGLMWLDVTSPLEPTTGD